MVYDFPPSMATSSSVGRDRIEKAVNALLKWKESQSKTQKPQLIPQDNFIYLNLTLRKIPASGRTNPFRIPLPHPLHDSSSELCLIIDDRPNSKLTSQDAKKVVKSLDIPVSKVLKFSKLKKNYKPFEAKRKLCNSFDVFFVDRRIVPLLPKLLGKHFLKDKKLPLPVDLTKKNWKEQIERALSSALLFIGTGTCSVVKVGRESMESEEIVDNIMTAIDGIDGIVPKGWKGVRSLHLKFSNSLALPVYQTLPETKLKIEGITRNKEEIKEENAGEMELGEMGKSDEESGKKMKSKKKNKGRICEVRYMDVSVGGNELVSDEDEDEKDEVEHLGSAESVEKKWKKGNLIDEKSTKKMQRIKSEVSIEDEDGIDKSDGNGEVRAETEGKKRKKGYKKKSTGKVEKEVNVKQKKSGLKNLKEDGAAKKADARHKKRRQLVQ